MSSALVQDFNHARFRPEDTGGHYESYFQRANHPTKPQAFWIRYTAFSPRGRPQDAIGELWAVYFDAESGPPVAAKLELPIVQCNFARDHFAVQIGDADLSDGQLRGTTGAITWDLSYSGGQAPALTLPPDRYAARLPRAKLLVGVPNAIYRGQLLVNGRPISIDGWIGSQNHNWGSRHTDRYAYGQVCGFDEAPDSFLELATAQVRIGPLLTPRLTPILLRHQGREIALNSVATAIRARADYGWFDWRFRSQDRRYRIEGEVSARREDFVALRYFNPSGGAKCCLNTKIAQCSLQLTDRSSGQVQRLSSRNRAAFEMLGDEWKAHGVPVSA